MGRVRIEEPEAWTFDCELALRAEDVNAAGHVGFDRMVALVNEASAQYFAHLGLDRFRPDPVGVIYADLAVTFTAEVFYPDTLRCRCGPGRVGSRSMELVVQAVSVQTGKTACSARIGVVFFDYQRRRPAAIPAWLRARLDLSTRQAQDR